MMVAFKTILVALLGSFLAFPLRASPVFERAEKLAWRHNWAKARPLYAQALEEFEVRRDLKAATAARLGWILSRIYTVSSQGLLEELEVESRKIPVMGDPGLQLRYLAAKAYLEEQPNLLASRRAWEQVLDIARRLGNQEWQTRAT